MQRHNTQIASRITRTYDTCDDTLFKKFSSKVIPGEEQPYPLLQQMTKMSETQRARREQFLEAEKVWDAQVQWESLTNEEKEIVKAHKQAVMNGHFTYHDKKLGRKVMTRLRHFLRGSCCGNACRHVCEIATFLFSFLFLQLNSCSYDSVCIQPHQHP